MGLVVVEGVESPLDLPSDTLIFMPRVGNSVGNCKFGQQKRGYDFHRNPLISFMAGVTRLELATSGVTDRHSGLPAHFSPKDDTGTMKLDTE